MEDVIIIGAGLSGLTAAYELKKMGVNAQVLEARSRFGGRIWTLAGEERGTPMEMGATWFGDKHRHLLGLISELGIPYFPQYTSGIALLESMSFAPPQRLEIPQTEAPYHRIRGGSRAIINALARAVGEKRVELGQIVVEARATEKQITLFTQEGNAYHCRYAISTLPPRLLQKTVNFHPALPAQAAEVMANTHTWMSDSIKFAVEYARPFWREHGFSGTAYSQAGPATEIYDHTNAEETAFALKGFLAAGTSGLKDDDRREMVLRQLVRLFGLEAADFLSYEDWVWSREQFTHVPYEGYMLPHQNSGHPLFAEPLLGGRLFLAGTETSPEFGGYMDGAVLAGALAADRVAQLL